MMITYETYDILNAYLMTLDIRMCAAFGPITFARVQRFYVVVAIV